MPPIIPAATARSCSEHLFGRVNLPPDASTSSTATPPIRRRSARATRRAIAEAGGIDLQMLGIGTNGHIGFNEPAAALQARTHRVTLKPETRRSNAALFGGDADAVPAEALSMGMATILHARAIVLLATGRSKARVRRRRCCAVRSRPSCRRRSCSCTRTSTSMLDEAAAAARGELAAPD